MDGRKDIRTEPCACMVVPISPVGAELAPWCGMIGDVCRVGCGRDLLLLYPVQRNFVLSLMTTSRCWWVNVARGLRFAICLAVFLGDAALLRCG